MPVDSLIDYLEAEDSLDEFLDNVHSVSREAAMAALGEGKAFLPVRDEAPHRVGIFNAFGSFDPTSWILTERLLAPPSGTQMRNR